MNIYIVTFLFTSTIFVLVLYILQAIYKDKLIISKRINRINTSVTSEVVTKQKQKLIHDRSVDSNVKILKKLANELFMAGVLMRPSEFLFIWALTTFAPAGLFFIIKGDYVVSLAIFLVGFFLPPFFLYRKKTKRIELFEKQLAEAVAVICNCLRAGLTFQQALVSISNEMPEPISKEFGRVLREVKLGNTLERALTNMSDRLKSKDSVLIVSAVLIQRQIGGNLSEILSSIAVTITERYKIKSEIKVLTTTGRTSGLVVGFMPIIILLLFMIINPGYIRSFFETTIGIGMLVASAVLELIGFLIIRRIVNVKF